MDVVISATASPHYTLTGTKVKEHMTTDKPRVFVDLAVPVDIEETIAEFPHTFFYNMDDLEELAETNNRAKKEAVCQAGEILEEFEEDFMRWMIFQQAVPRMQEVKHWMEEEAEKRASARPLTSCFTESGRMRARRSWRHLWRICGSRRNKQISAGFRKRSPTEFQIENGEYNGKIIRGGLRPRRL